MGNLARAMASLLPLWGSLQVKSADLTAGNMEEWRPRNSSTISLEATLAQREAQLKKQNFANSWRGAGYFKSATHTHPVCPKTKKNFPPRSLWDPDVHYQEICPGAGSPFTPVGVAETSPRVKFTKIQEGLAAAGHGGVYSGASGTPRGTPRRGTQHPALAAHGAALRAGCGAYLWGAPRLPHHRQPAHAEDPGRQGQDTQVPSHSMREREHHHQGITPRRRDLHGVPELRGGRWGS